MPVFRLRSIEFMPVLSHISCDFINLMNVEPLVIMQTKVVVCCNHVSSLLSREILVK